MSSLDISEKLLTNLNGIVVPTDLVTLIASTNDLTDISAIVNTSIFPTSLKELNLSNNITLGSLTLSTMLATSTNLWERLYFAQCGLEDLNWNALAFANCLGTLTYLDISYNNLSISVLASSLGSCTVLNELILSYNTSLTEFAGLPSSIITLVAEACAIDTLVGMPQNVVSLYVQNNESLTDLTGASAELRLIDLTGTGVTEYSALRTAAPQCNQILHYGAPMSVISSSVSPLSITNSYNQNISIGTVPITPTTQFINFTSLESTSDGQVARSSSWTTTSTAVYPGSAVNPLSSFNVVASTSHPNNGILCRLQDVTNNKTIATVTFGGITPNRKTNKNSCALKNVPYSKAILELQTRSVLPNFPGKIYGAMLY